MNEVKKWETIFATLMKMIRAHMCVLLFKARPLLIGIAQREASPPTSRNSPGKSSLQSVLQSRVRVSRALEGHLVLLPSLLALLGPR